MTIGTCISASGKETLEEGTYSSLLWGSLNMCSSGGTGLRLRIMLKGQRRTIWARARLNKSSILRRNRAWHNRGDV
jgi:hypothetical protein